ncbi:MAG: amidohydrolase family protein [Desulfobacteraceae bacterium]|nr:amidohydrolase family protein [Desulfobacteraceae bacterium]
MTQPTSSPIIDFHTHLFPASIRTARERFFHGEPAFRLLYDSPKSRMVGVEELIAAMDEDGVDRSVVFGFPWRSLEKARLNNDYILEAVARYPERLAGLCCLGPGAEGATAEVARCLDAGLAGIGELAFYTGGIEAADLDHLAEPMALCRERGRLALIHTNEPVGHVYPGKTPNTLRQIYDLVGRFPENKIVLAHWGGGIFFYSLLKKEVGQRLANVWFDTAASPYLYDARIWAAARDTIGVDKILFGTDFPLLRASRYLKEIQASGLSADQCARVLGGNAVQLLAQTT